MKKKTSRIAVPLFSSETGMPTAPDQASFIVGIGAAADRIDALERLLKGVPEQSGMAYAVVHHPDPENEQYLLEFLQKISTIPVVQIADGSAVEPDRLYHLPSGRVLSVSDGFFRLREPVDPPGEHLPIDHFFRLMASEMGGRCTTVILSGVGSDGFPGLQSISRAGGCVFVQDPSNADQAAGSGYGPGCFRSG